MAGTSPADSVFNSVDLTFSFRVPITMADAKPSPDMKDIRTVLNDEASAACSDSRKGPSFLDLAADSGIIKLAKQKRGFSKISSASREPVHFE